ncbi:MAG: radical SAM protein [Candidatus Krumholzibacteria bacterium]|nr:radical SAM protein [Candidatus Krumholzibacteria bacterium]
MLKDGIGREINYLRISVTDRCNLRCEYCMPPEGIELKSHGDMLTFEEIEAVVRAAVRLGIGKVRLTGGEPLVRRGMAGLVRILREINGLEEISMTTNGILLTSDAAAELKKAGLDRLNISLDTLDPARYRNLTRGGDVADVLRGITAAQAAGFEGTKVNMVVTLPGSHEDVEMMKSFCAREGLVLQTINRFSLLKRTTETESPHDFDRPLPCAKCNRLRLTADGYLKPCLFSDIEIKVDFEDIEGSIRKAVEAKPVEGTSCSNRSMKQIGG